MRNRQNRLEAVQLANERRLRENAAPRLQEKFPRLEELSIEVDEYRGGAAVVGARHTRRVVVGHAPAHFEIPCTEERCTGGGYDITSQVLDSLRSLSVEFEGEDSCLGSVGADPCGRSLHFTARAKYVVD